MRCMKNVGCFSPGKLSSHTMVLPSCCSFPPLCSVFMFPYQKIITGCETYTFTTDLYGIFDVYTYLGACCTHEVGSGTNKSAQELTWRDRKTVPHPAPPGDRTQGHRIIIPTPLTTELRQKQNADAPGVTHYN